MPTIATLAVIGSQRTETLGREQQCLPLRPSGTPPVTSVEHEDTGAGLSRLWNIKISPTMSALKLNLKSH